MFDELFTQLKHAIKHAQSKLSVAKRLVDKLKMCHQFKDEGIIDEARYIPARTAIFKYRQ